MSASLASALLLRLHATLPGLPPEDRRAALDALGPFLDDASPSRFLAARRALVEAARARLRERSSPHLFRRALESLAAAGLDADVVSHLADLPLDAAARLDALAALFVSHGELSARVAVVTAVLRARLERR